ncbi:hypothetical protein ACFFIY_00720 [Bhargavaea ullalensis]|uniref:Ferredoxin n=1 Tax=Bhargavaea ullalensis TaxID=1265685 RepID=A0ABV2GE73_9BACL
MSVFRRSVHCTNCSREIRDGEEITAMMTPPDVNTMVEIRAYLNKKSRVLCNDCADPEKHK